VTAPLRVGLSTCPNDTFAFHALLEGEVDAGGLDVEWTLADVQELNEAMRAGELDAAKVSFHAALRMADRVRVLRAGSALGFGVGPVLIGGPGRTTESPRVLAPGADTTASMLLALYRPELCPPEQVVFSAILPALARGRADLGVCIHEGRFTFESLGLELVEDLGATWEADTGAPLPLGGVVCRAERAAEGRRLSAALAASIDWAGANREATLPTLRRHAQELSDDVLWAHVDLYVNARTRDLGAEGRAALAALAERAADRGLVPRGTRLEVL
jgi:1,4-dihydroxy-6-naphthoate synthase